MWKPSLVMDCSRWPSYSGKFCTAYSSMGSVMYSTSRFLARSFSRNGEFSTAATLSPAM
jgi:hypothetical protein